MLHGRSTPTFLQLLEFSPPAKFQKCDVGIHRPCSIYWAIFHLFFKKCYRFIDGYRLRVYPCQSIKSHFNQKFCVSNRNVEANNRFAFTQHGEFKRVLNLSAGCAALPVEGISKKILWLNNRSDRILNDFDGCTSKIDSYFVYWSIGKSSERICEHEWWRIKRGRDGI